MVKITRFNKYGREWFTTKEEAIDARKKGDRLYYSAEMKSYYLIRTKKRNFLGFCFILSLFLVGCNTDNICIETGELSINDSTIEPAQVQISLGKCEKEVKTIFIERIIENNTKQIFNTTYKDLLEEKNGKGE